MESGRLDPFNAARCHWTAQTVSTMYAAHRIEHVWLVVVKIIVQKILSNTLQCHVFVSYSLSLADSTSATVWQFNEIFNVKSFLWVWKMCTKIASDERICKYCYVVRFHKQNSIFKCDSLKPQCNWSETHDYNMMHIVQALPRQMKQHLFHTLLYLYPSVSRSSWLTW